MSTTTTPNKSPYLSAQSWSQFGNQVTDQGSEAGRDITFWLPTGLSPNQFFLGMTGVNNYDAVAPSSLSTYVFTQEGDNTLLARPTGFYPVWTCVGNDQSSNLGIYKIIAPEGYVGLGCIAVPNFNTPPQVADYPQLMCVRGDLVNNTLLTDILVWNDQGSGAPLDVSVWMSPCSEIVIPTIGTGYPNTMYVADLAKITI